MNFPDKMLFPLLPLLVIINNCSFVPLPFTYINNGKTVYDTIALIKDDPTSNDMVLSSLTGKDCRIFNVINHQEICEEPFDPPVELYQATLMETDMTW